MRRLIGTCMVVSLVLITVTDAAQNRFRVSYHRDRDEPSSIVLGGTVFNDDDRDVVEVWVTAEALNSAGTVVATGITFASGLIRGHGNASFVAKIPRVESAREFRLAVTSFRYGSMAQSP